MCRPGVEIRVVIDDQEIIGPITSENLAYIAKFSGGTFDAFDDMLLGQIKNIHLYITYLPGKKP
jgi:hypothetical protein